MKRKLLITMISVLMAIVCVFGLIGCDACDGGGGGTDDPTVVTPTTFIVTFNTDGGSRVNNQRVAEGGTLSNIPTTEKEGFTFIGWFDDDGNQLTLQTVITKNTTFTARWEENEHVDKVTVTFDSDGGTPVDPIQVEKGGVITDIPACEKEGFNFNGWYDADGKRLTSSTVIDDDCSFTARWIDPSTIPGSHTVSFDSDGGDEVDAVVVRDGYTLSSVPELERDGYLFLGWYDDEGNMLTTATKITEDKTYKAKWIEYNPDNPDETRIFTVHFDPNGGDEVPAIENVKYGSTLDVIPEPSREGFIFEGWFDANNAKLSKYTHIVAESYYTARWTAEEVEIDPDLDKEVFVVNGVKLKAVVQSGEVMNYTVVGYADDAAGAIEIPSSYEGKPVTTIISNAFKGNDTITSILVPDSITTINNSAFAGCTSVRSINIPDSVTTLGTYIFSGCTSLSGVTLPDGMTSIPNFMFKDCSSLTEVTIPDSVTTLGNSLFYGCSSLETVNIPVAVTTIPYSAFYNCSSLKQITLPEGLDTISTYAFFNCSSLQNVKIPDSVKMIDAYGFNSCTSMTSLTLPAVDELNIGSNAFFGCTGLTLVNWNPAKCTTTATEANPIFANCTSIGIVNIGENVEEIPAYAFTKLSSLTTLTMPDSGNLKAINKSAFSGCSSLETLQIPEGVTTIADKAFANCSKIENLNVPDSVVSIGKGAFEGCSSLANLTVPFIGGSIDSNNNFGYIFGATNYKDNAKVVPASLENVKIKAATEIEDNAFADCGLSKLDLPDTVTTIGNSAFVGNDIKSFDIPESVTSIGKSAFKGNENLSTVNFNAANCTVAGHKDNPIFEDCDSLTTINIGDNVTNIPENVFKGCASIENLVIPDSVETIGKGALQGCDSLVDLSMPFIGSSKDSVDNAYLGYIFGADKSADNPKFIPESLDTVSVTDKSSIGSGALSGAGLKKIEIAPGTTIIGANAFSGNKITTLFIPKSVQEIGANAFKDNPELESIVFENGSELVKIDDSAFAGCQKLSGLILPVSIKEIGNNAFYNCNIATLVIPSKMASIGDNAFAMNTELEELTFAADNELEKIGASAFADNKLKTVALPNSIKEVGFGAFENSSALEKIELPFTGAESDDDEVVHFGYIFGANAYTYNAKFVPATLKEVVLTGDKAVGDRSFYGCGNVTSVHITGNVPSLGNYVFSNCPELSDIVLPDSITAIGGYVFSGLSKLVSINIPSGVSNIGNSMFYECVNLKDVKIPEGVTGIGSSAFYGCTSLTSINIPNGVTTIGASAFANCTQLTSVTLPESATTLGGSLFEGCASLTGIVLPDSVDGINEFMFKDCTALATITMPAGATTVGGSAFSGCISLTSVTIPGKVESIGSSAFSGCTSLTTLSITDGVKTIGNSAFGGCDKITTVTIPESVTSVGNRAFSGCTALRTVNWNAIDCKTASTSQNFTVFENCSSIDAVNFGSQVITVPAYAFYGCENVFEFTIPQTVENIGKWAFANCGSLTSVVWNAENCTVAGTEENTIFDGCALFSFLTLGNSVETIPAYAFMDQSRITYVEFPATLREVGDKAFYNTKLAGDYTMPASLKKVGDYAFYNNVGITGIKLGANSLLEWIGDYAFSGCTNIAEFASGENESFEHLKKVGANTFSNCTKLPAFAIAEDTPLETIGENAFLNCVLLQQAIIPETVTAVGTGAYKGCTALKSILWSAPLVKQDYTGSVHLFDGCTGVESITVTDNVERLPQNVFYGCTKIKSISLPFVGEHLDGTGKTHFGFIFGAAAYSNNAANVPTTLTDVTIVPSSVKDKDLTITDYAFSGCAYIATVYVPNTYGRIGASAFTGCKAIKEITLPFIGNTLDNDTAGTTGLFGYIFGSASYTGGTATKQYYQGTTQATYYIPTTLKKVTITGGNVLYGAFSLCSLLTDITIYDKVQVIGDRAFQGCTSLVNFTLADMSAAAPALIDEGEGGEGGEGGTETPVTPEQTYKLRYIGEYAFSGCSKLVEFDMPSTVTNICAYAFQNCNVLKDMEIPEGVNVINTYAFQNCKAFTTVTLSKNITAISAYAYFGCTSLKTFTVEGGFESKMAEIGNYAFSGCTALTDLTLPEGGVLATIGTYAFQTCSSLTSVAVPDTVETIGTAAFSGCIKLVEMTLPFIGNSKAATAASNATVLGYIFGTTSYTGGTATAQHYTASNTTSYYIPNTLTKVTVTGGSLFYGAFDTCTKLTEIYIPDTVTAIPDYAFKGCTALKKVQTYTPGANNDDPETVLPESVLTIGAYAFQNTVITELVIPKSVTSLGTYAFSGCAKMTALTFGTEGYAADSALETLGTYAFSGCTLLETIELPAALVTISDYAFNGCSKLATVSFGDPDSGDSVLATIGIYAFQNCKLLNNVRIPASVKTINNYAYNGCTGMTSFVYADDSELTTIGQNVFSGCTGLTTATIPASVTSVGNYAYTGCTGLTSVEFIDGGANKTLGTYVFNGCNKLTSVVVTNNVTQIGNFTFAGCSSLVEITLPFVGNKVATAASAATLFGCIFGTGSYTGGTATQQYYSTSAQSTYYIPSTLRKVTITGGHILFGSFDKCSMLTEINMSGSTMNIGQWAFRNCTGLVHVTIPSTVPALDTYSFLNCSKLETVDFGDGITASSLVTIGTYAFQGCTVLNNVALPASLKTLNNYAFTGCVGLTNVTFGDETLEDSALTTMGTYVFNGCTGLTGITIPKSLTGIGDYAFNGCTSLTNVEIKNGVKTVGIYAFQNCSALTGIQLPNSITTVGNYAFIGCSELVSATFGTGITSIGTNVFQNCVKLTTSLDSTGSPLNKVVLPSGINTVSNYLFSGCSSLEYVDIPNSVVTIGTNAFERTALSSIDIPANITSIGNYAFSGCTSVGSITFASNSALTTIGTYVFENCSEITTISLPASVNLIGMSAFAGCGKLESMTLPFVGTSKTSKTAGENMLFGYIFGTNSYSGGVGVSQYYSASGVKTYYIPSGLTQVNVLGGFLLYGAFYNCTMLTDVILPNASYTICDYAFFNCSGLTSVEIPKATTGVSACAFMNCTSLTEVTFEAGAVITTLATNSFKNCSAMTKIEIPATVTTIGASLFSGCGAMEELVLPFVGNSKTSTSAVAAMLFGYIFGNTTYEGGEATVQHYTSAATTTYYIPATLEKVTVLGGNILYGAFDQCKNIKQIILPDTLTSIGDAAFQSCESLTSLNIPANVTTLGAYSVLGCVSLSTVTFGDGTNSKLTTIGTGAFSQCFLLNNVTIPDKVTTINAKAFEKCYALATLYLDAALTTIGANAFEQCLLLSSIAIPANVTTLGAAAFKGCTSLATATFDPATKLTVFNDEVFCNTGLTSINVPAQITSLGQKSLAGCNNLTSIEFGDESVGNSLLTSIGISALEGSGDYFAPITVNVPENVTTLGKAALSSSGIGAINFVGTSKLTTVGEAAFKYTAISTITLPDTVTALGVEAFMSCNNLVTVNLSAALKTIGVSAFAYCSSLSAITIPDGVTTLGASVFEYCTALTSATVPNSVTNIGAKAFAGCSSLESLVLPFVGFNGSNVSGHYGKFYYLFCDATVYTGSPVSTVPASLTSVTVNGGKIADGAFEGCSNISSITLYEGLTSIGASAFAGTGLTGMTIPSTVTTIGTSAFANSGLISIVVPNTVTTIGKSAFASCNSLTNISVPFIGEKVTSTGDKAVFSYIFDNSVEEDLTAVPPVVGVPLTMPASLTVVSVTGGEIPANAFAGCTAIQKVIIHDELTLIGDNAFNGCTAFTTLQCNPTTSKLFEIGNNAFAGTAISTITLPESLDKIGNNAFAGTGLTSIVLPDSVTALGDETFKDCVALTSVTLSNSLTTLQTGLFENCTLLTSITLNNGLLVIGANAFKGSGIASIAIPSTVTNIRASAFEGSALTAVTFNTVNQLTIGDKAFKGTSLSALTLPDKLISIGAGAFEGLTLATATLTVPDTVNVIGEGAFANTNISTITLPFVGGSKTATTERELTYGYVFNGYTEAGVLIAPVPATVIITGGTISDDAFAGCAAVTSITLPNTITAIGERAFAGVGASTITLPNSVLTIGAEAFKGAPNLTTVNIGTGMPGSKLTSIGDDAFADCTALTNVTFSGKAEDMDDIVPDVTVIGLPSGFVIDCTLAPAPLAAPSPAFTDNVLSWSAIENATGYKVYSVADDLSTTLVATLGSSQTSYTVAHSTVGSYSYNVVTLGDGNFMLDSAASATVTYTVSKLATPVISVSDSGVISWTAVPDATRYVVYHYGIEAPITTVDAPATSYTITETTLGSYTYTIKAQSTLSAFLDSDMSNAVNYKVTQQLATPVVTFDSDTKTLSWTAITNATDYEIHENGVCVATLTDVTSYTIAQTNGGDYTYVVKAINRINALYTPSAASNSTAYHVTGALAAPVISIDEDGKITWTAIASADSYEVFEDGTSLGTTANTYYNVAPTDTGSYSYTVKALPVAGDPDFTASAVSNAVVYNKHGALLAPTGIALSDDTLSWSAVSGANKYEVYKDSDTTPLTTVSALSADLSTLLTTGIYSITVKAINDIDTAFTASAASTAATYNRYGKLATPVITLTGDTLSWTAVNGADGYEVYVGATKVADETGTSHTVSQSTAGKYKYTVIAVSSDAGFTASDASDEVEYIKATQLDAPTGLTLDVDTKTLSWTAVSDADITGYNVYLSSDKSTTPVKVNDAAITGTSYMLASLPTVIDKYYYTVTAVSTNVLRSESAASGAAEYLKTEALTAPNVLIENGVISWTANANASSYEIYREGTLIDTITAASYNVRDNEASSPLGQYTYSVKAIADTTKIFYTDSAMSNNVVYTKSQQLSAPANLALDTANSKLSWDEVTNATGYEVYCNGTKDDEAVITDTGSGIEAEITLPTTPGNYSYTVKAISSNVIYTTSDASSAVSYKKTSQLATPENVEVNDTTLSWDAVENATKYVVTEDDGTTVSTYDVEDGTSYDLSGKGTGSYSYTVKAVRDGDLYPDSDESAAVSYVVA